MLDTVLNAVAEGTRAGIVARVRATDSNRLRLQLTDTARELLLDSCDGAELADAIIDDVIETLRRTLPGQTRQTLELILADARADAANRLGEFVDGLIDCNQFINEAIGNLSDGGDAL